MASVAPVVTAIALAALLPAGALAQSGGNPWNPYSSAPKTQSAPAPLVQPTPQFVSPTPTPAPAPVATAPAAPRQQAPSRFAPPGLDEKLEAGAQRLLNPVPPAVPVTPPAAVQAPVPLAVPTPAPAPVVPPVAGTVPGTVPGGYATTVPGYVPQYGYGYAPGYGGYYVPGYGANPYSGYGVANPYSPYGIPGGLGGFVPFPGNITNGGVPGFNFSPFGFF